MSDDNNTAVNYSAEGWSGSEQGISAYFVVFLSLLALVLVLSKFLHDQPRLASVLPEAGMVIIIGLISGAIILLLTPHHDLNANSKSTNSTTNNNANGYQYEADDDPIGEEDALFSSEMSQHVAEGLLSFSPMVFFQILLPPIIFNSGYNLKTELFFRHITPIALFACVGTAISAISVATLLELVKRWGLTGNFQPQFTELLTFGALISATDPVSTLAVFQAKKVDPQLFYLIFGESVLNDAVGLVMFNSLAQFVGAEENAEHVIFMILKFLLDFSISFIGSTILGVLSGMAAALLLKMVNMQYATLLEVSLYILFMYLPFFIAESMKLSGIVTILFTGIAAKRYAEPNLSVSTEENADILFRVTAHLAETSIFLELGLSVFGLSSYGNFHLRFILWAILACLIGRALNVYPLRYLYNMSLRRKGKQSNATVAENRSQRQNPLTEENEFHYIENIDAIVVGNSDCFDSKTVASDATLTPTFESDLKIGINTAHMLWFSGLRGAVAYACAKTFPNNFGNRTPFVVATMTIVLVTVFLLGGTTEMALNRLKIDVYVDEDDYMKNKGTHIKVGTLYAFENRYINRFVIRDYKNNGRYFINNVNQSGSPKVNKMPGLAEMSETEDSSGYIMGTVEMTQSVHLETLRSHGFIDETSNVKRKRSLYDFGAH